jgi:hypothetical protein
MSFEIIGGAPETAYAPLNTTIDRDRDYYSLTGLDACVCGGGGLKTRAQMGTGPGVQGYYDGGQLPEGMLEAVEGGNKLLWVLGGLLAAWGVWAWRTPVEPLGEEW